MVQIQYDCKAALFRMDMENADDIRLNTVLFKACLNDKRMFCPNVFPGNGRAEICLEEHMATPGFTAECRCALPPLPLFSARNPGCTPL